MKQKKRTRFVLSYKTGRGDKRMWGVTLRLTNASNSQLANPRPQRAKRLFVSCVTL